MFTIQKIKDNFHLSKTFSFNENIGSYTETLTEEFSDFGGFCDIYIEEFNNESINIPHPKGELSVKLPEVICGCCVST